MPAPGTRVGWVAGACLGRGGGSGSLGSGHRSVNSEQAEACQALLTLPAPETRVRPLQVEKPGSGLCCSWLQNAADSRISVALRREGGSAMLGEGERSCHKTAI